MLAYFLWVTLSRSMTPIISRSTITKMAKGMKTYTPTVTGSTVGGSAAANYINTIIIIKVGYVNIIITHVDKPPRHHLCDHNVSFHL